MLETIHLTRQELPEIARVHLRAFPDSALTALGAEAVRRYYSWLLDGPHESHSIGIRVSGELAGFCFGGVFRGAMSGYLQANRRYLTLLVLSRPWLIGNSLFRDRLRLGIRLLRRLRKRPQAPPGPENQKIPSYAILVIAVNPEFQGRGIGRSLMEEAEIDARRRGFERMHLGVNPGNAQAIRFYEGLGWIKSTIDDIWRGEMIKPLNEN
ncbi:MAG: GNAT family N-acetyltransferase [Acidobacteriota bacterium]|nr:MAG: GNAT family N-acetyltransferase [Acidobacteriota bacterium]